MDRMDKLFADPAVAEPVRLIGELLTFLEGLAQRQADAGRRNLPGVTLHEERTAQ
jgi:hypothetical protein